MNKLYVVSRTGQSVGFSSRGPAVWAMLRVLSRSPKGTTALEIAKALLVDNVVLEVNEVESTLARLIRKNLVRRAGGKYVVAQSLFVTSALPAAAAFDSRENSALNGAIGDSRTRQYNGHLHAKIDWASVDWVLPDAYLARQFGLTRERFRQKRLESGAPNSPLKNLSDSSVHLYEWVLQNGHRVARLSTDEIVEASGIACSSAQISRVMGAAGIPWTDNTRRRFSPRKRLAMGFNWDLPNRDLSEIWNMHNVAVSKFRSSLAAGTARWDARRLANRHHRNLPVDYVQALTEERVRATGALRRAS